MKTLPTIAAFASLLAVASCKTGTETVDTPVAEAAYYQEPFRPKVHFSPEANWMNDPNGMFFLDGEYHLFYQYYPDSTVWGPMHWGHAVSSDLVNWQHLPVALYPDSLGYIFSGSAVVDANNTSGLGTKDNPPVVAIFTYHDPVKEKAGDNAQSQGLAFSTDKGRTWTKYKNNPVLKSPGIRDFRDPKVAWNDRAAQWVMTLAVSDHIEFYGSPDLKQWNKLSEFGKIDGAHGGVWECPDLFEMKDESGKSRYVLLVSINPGAPNGGSGTQYFVGDFDGKQFVSETPGKETGWIDYGPDDYAGVTINNIAAHDGRRIFIGWMSNWLYAQAVPTDPWRSAMTVPRTLALKTAGESHVLTSTPVKELATLIEAEAKIDPAGDTTAFHLSTGTPYMVQGELPNEDFVLELSNMAENVVEIGFDKTSNTFYIDRSQSGVVDFYADFNKRITAPRNSRNPTVEFTMIVDAASAEIFFDGGSTNLTTIFFPDGWLNQFKVFGKSVPIRSPVKLTELKSAWR